MVKIRATQSLKDYLFTNGLPIRDFYEYKDIRSVLINGPAEVLQNCSFVWPEKKIEKPSPLIEKIKERRKVRLYQEMISNVTFKQPDTFKEMTSGLAMGLTFISILFVGMLSGYYLGRYYFGFQVWGSLVVSFVITVIGIYVEVLLYLIKSKPKKAKVD